MPRATQELRDAWPGDHNQAFRYLKERGFTGDRFILRPPTEGYKLTEREGSAIDYLCDEWDYGWEPK